MMKHNENRCLVCGDVFCGTYITIKEMQFGTGHDFDYFQCENCESLQIVNIPRNMEEYYPDNYYSFTPIRTAVTRPIAAKLLEQALFLLQHPLVSNPARASVRRMKLDLNTKILDVGCGSGGLLLWLRSLGFRSLLGIDPNIKADIKYSNGLQILKKDIFDLTGKWDVVMFHHSLEHVSDPVAVMRQAHKLLARGGICLVRVPILSSFAWRYYGTNWVQLDAPRHISLFSLKTAGYVAGRTGFKLKRFYYDSDDFQFWASSWYRRGNGLSKHKLRSGEGGMLLKLELIPLRIFAKLLNFLSLGDQVTIYFEKV